MHGLQKKYSVHVVVATVFASAMILMTDNGVADAVKITEGQKRPLPLPPPGPFELISSQGGNTVTGAGGKHLAPAAPNTLNIKQVAPKQGIAPPVTLEPVSKSIKQNVAGNEPVFQKTTSSMSQALQTINSPVNLPQPVVPIMPGKRMVPPSENRLAPTTVPQFRGNLGQLKVAPQIQQYRYIPLPVYQSNYYNYPQSPSFNSNAPGYWVPQINN